MEKKLFSGILIGIVVLSLTFNFAIAFQKSDAINDINSYNNIEKLDDNNCLIHSGNAFSKNDLLVTKETDLDKFDYKIFDNNTKDEIYNFSSTESINFGSGKIYNNINSCTMLFAVTKGLLKDIPEGTEDKSKARKQNVMNELKKTITDTSVLSAAITLGKDLFTSEKSEKSEKSEESKESKKSGTWEKVKAWAKKNKSKLIGAGITSVL